MRRRARPELPDVPAAALLRFRLWDWADRVPSEPAWWSERESYPWVTFKARLLWIRARREWVAAHGVDLLDLKRGGDG